MVVAGVLAKQYFKLHNLRQVWPYVVLKITIHTSNYNNMHHVGVKQKVIFLSLPSWFELHTKNIPLKPLGGFLGITAHGKYSALSVSTFFESLSQAKFEVYAIWR